MGGGGAVGVVGGVSGCVWRGLLLALDGSGLWLSGGPRWLEDGRVGGVVFAQSKVDSTVGYALAPEQVLNDVTPALGRVQAVSTGPCLN